MACCRASSGSSTPAAREHAVDQGRVAEGLRCNDLTKRDAPGVDFNCFERPLLDNELYAVCAIGGVQLADDREKYLNRLFPRIVRRTVRPTGAVRALMREIAFPSRIAGAVGAKVLAFTIPKRAAEKIYNSGDHFILAMEQPDLHSPSFYYLDPSQSKLQQYGPTAVCGDSAVTIEVESDPARAYQSSAFYDERTVIGPKRRGSTMYSFSPRWRECEVGGAMMISGEAWTCKTTPRPSSGSRRLANISATLSSVVQDAVNALLVARFEFPAEQRHGRSVIARKVTLQRVDEDRQVFSEAAWDAP